MSQRGDLIDGLLRRTLDLRERLRFSNGTEPELREELMVLLSNTAMVIRYHAPAYVDDVRAGEKPKDGIDHLRARVERHFRLLSEVRKQLPD